MQTIIPKAIGLLGSFAQMTADGLHALGAILGMLHNTEAIVLADLEAAVTADSESQLAKAAQLAAQAAQDAASAKAATFLTVTRELLKPTLGSRYSVLWNQAGFLHATLSVPRSVPARLAMVRSVQMFFAARPDLETAGVATQGIANALYESLADSIEALIEARVVRREKSIARDKAVTALRERLRDVRRELQGLLDDDDTRWLRFGFNIPADHSVPAAPEELTATAGAIGSAVLNWARSVGASRYRVFRQIVGVDAEFVHVATVTGVEALLSDLEPGAHVKFYATAANEAGESVPSTTVEMIVP